MPDAPAAPNPANPASPDNFHGALSAHRASLASQPETPAAPAPGPGNEPGLAASQTPEGFEPEATEQEGEQEAEQVEADEQIQDLLEEAIHGRKGREILEALKRGELPAELLAQLKATAKINGEDVPVTLQEALSGYQRTSDYTRQKKETARERQEARDLIDQVNGMIEGWTNGDSLLSSVRKLGKMDAFEQAAIKYAKERYEDARLEKENPQAYAARQELRKEREAREALEQRLKTQPDPRQQQRTQAFAQELKSLVVPAFEKHAIKDSAFARERFKDNFSALYEEGCDLAACVEDSVRATAEELSDLAVKYQASQQQKPANDNGKKPNPSPLPGRPQGAPSSGGSHRKQPTRPEDFQAYLQRRRGIR